MAGKPMMRVQHKQVLLTLSIFMAVVLTFLLVSSLLESTQTQAAAQYSTEKCYTSLQIEEGDTLWEIAETYCGGSNANIQKYVTELKMLNHIQEDQITAGEYLVIPYYEVIEL
ncbi:MAG: LysM peptidoglycan-binding domain-containing protein [Lachnospiraceae bacterium]